MADQSNIILAIRGLCELFALHSKERTTLDEILRVSLDKSCWQSAHKLFQRIRDKNLKALKANDVLLQAQYSFEESCAKSLYNLSGASAPFDVDSPYRIVPRAFAVARAMGVSDDEVVRIIAG